MKKILILSLIIILCTTNNLISFSLNSSMKVKSNDYIDLKFKKTTKSNYQEHEKNSLECDSYFFTMFYNVENFFDTINDTSTEDESFLPHSKKLWNSKKYFNKIKQLSKVFYQLMKDENDNNFPNIIGLAEIENKLVIEDLLKDSVFKNHNYSIIHKDSPDRRGIDCAILYSNQMSLIEKNFIEVKIPKSNKPTRDIVHAKFNYLDNIINVFVNHWPSRWGGQKETNYKRVFTSNLLMNYIHNNINEDEYVFIIGDFNDYPNNESMQKIVKNNYYHNLMKTEIVSGIGSYNYKGTWNWLDQIIYSSNLITKDFKIISGGSFQKKFMMYESNYNGQTELYPSRTFGGNKHYGGFSDHLPVFIKMGLNCNE